MLGFFINSLPFFQIPDNGLSDLSNRLMFFKHDYNTNNILQQINAVSDIVDETLVEIVLKGPSK